MPFIRNKPLELEFDNKGNIVAIKGETRAKDFNKQMKKLKELFNNGTN